MTDKQPEALRLAKEFDGLRRFGFEHFVLIEKAAAELRRLHEVNEELVGALSTLIGMAENFADELSHTHPVVKEAKAVLAKAQGENND